mmetsp:Transcript_29826/g.91323  ORF Transcript_29826/g.91323 Transcript_29826/m.91323 type:complete len:227 (+) Transcript_29826:1377-2057(+)
MITTGSSGVVPSGDSSSFSTLASSAVVSSGASWRSSSVVEVPGATRIQVLVAASAGTAGATRAAKGRSESPQINSPQPSTLATMDPSASTRSRGFSMTAAPPVAATATMATWASSVGCDRIAVFSLSGRRRRAVAAQRQANSRKVHVSTTLPRVRSHDATKGRSFCADEPFANTSPASVAALTSSAVSENAERGSRVPFVVDVAGDEKKSSMALATPAACGFWRKV